MSESSSNNTTPSCNGEAAAAEMDITTAAFTPRRNLLPSPKVSRSLQTKMAIMGSIRVNLLLCLASLGLAQGRLAAPSFLNNASLCERLHPEDLPEECSCREPGHYSVIIECLKDFESPYFNDTIGMKIDLDPCNKDGSRISLDVTERVHGIDFPIAGIKAGEERNIPIPGLSIVVPAVGHVGVDVAVMISGNPDSLTLKVGLNACAAMAHRTICASSIPGLSSILPWYVLSGTYSFGDICNSTTVSGVTAITGTTQLSES